MHIHNYISWVKLLSILFPASLLKQSAAGRSWGQGLVTCWAAGQWRAASFPSKCCLLEWQREARLMLLSQGTQEAGRSLLASQGQKGLWLKRFRPFPQRLRFLGPFGLCHSQQPPAFMKKSCKISPIYLLLGFSLQCVKYFETFHLSIIVFLYTNIHSDILDIQKNGD